MQRLSGLHQDWRMIGEVLLSLLILFPNAKISTLSALPYILGTFRPMKTGVAKLLKARESSASN
jgi:hypothetical protein